jgi:dolichyl-phosphate beta-glucosyltransferase
MVRIAYNSQVENLKIKMVFRDWNGALAYVGSAGIAGLLNTASVSMVKDHLTSDTAANLDSILLALTGVSMLVIALQFLYARAIGQGNRAPMSQGVVFSFVISTVVAGVAFLLIESTLGFKTEIALWLGIATFLSLVMCARLATLLINQEWIPICLLVLLSAAGRLVLWNITWFQSNITRLVIAIVLSNFVQVLYLYFSRRERKYTRIVNVAIQTQFVPMGILGGLVGIIGLGSISRRAALGEYATQFYETALQGRSVFFLVLIVAYASFPKICELPLFSRELGRYFRQAQILASVICVIAGSFLLLRNFLTDEGLMSYSTSHQQLAISIGLIGWAVLSLTVIPLLYFVAHNSRLGLAVYGPVVVMLIFQLTVTTPLSLSTGFLISSFFLLLIVSVPAFLRSRPTIRAEMFVHPDSQSSGTGSLTVVVPSYNSGKDGPKMVLAIYEALHLEVRELSVIAVSDGSTDESVALFDEISYPWFTHVRMEENCGKGAALRRGFAHSRTEITAFIDADGDIPPRLLLPMYQTINSEKADVVFGSKWHPESELQVTTFRRVVSFFHHIMQLLLFKLNIDDTQVGIKMYQTRHLQEVLPIVQENGFSLDLELFVAFSAYGHKRFVEMPVEIIRTGSSNISPGNISRALLDMLRIFWRARVSLNYDALAYTSTHELQKIRK